ncbi:MAG: bifunctional diguanylate cyclase/phosphodiesterase [Coriobacteriales bacterium]|nr:bifunctional diguanylate cyclase/phosphodiesterase [Coriobacteriales bacterium]
MGNRIKQWWGLVQDGEHVRKFLIRSNVHAAIYMTVIVILLECWMLFSLGQNIVQSAAAGKPRDLPWIVSHSAWYVGLMASAIVVLVCAVNYLHGKIKNGKLVNAILFVFSLACLVFGVHFGNNSYIQGEQVLAFVTMTLFVFGILSWKPIAALVLSTVAFGGFYLYIDHNAPATLGTQVNLFTLWIATFVVSLSSYHQKVSEANKERELEETNRRLRYIASYDELTGIPNMHTFRGAVAVLLGGIDELDTRFAISYMDLEGFKVYNGRYGFAAGDDLLRDFAQGLLKVFDNELVARFSDDHFVALCDADVVEDRIEAARELLHELRGDVRLHLKAGSYELTGEHDDVGLACDKARVACNRIKKMADKNLRWYDDAIEHEFQRKQYIINNVKRAVKEGWIKVFYQPVVRCSDGSGELCGYEALARWDDPTYGLLPPFAFIETLEEHREIDKLDRCIIEQVCRDLRAEMDAGQQPVPVSLNFSRLDFELYDVPGFLDEIRNKYHIPSKLLDVEITESALTEQFKELQTTMSSLRDESHSLWLDDFGSGYSSLNVLKDFQFNVLKIDMAFLRGFPENEKSGPILSAVVSLATELGLVSLCEGVETLEQFEFLHSIGCERAQGYYFGKPDPTKALPKPLA